jgi:hypothetical protein
MSYSDIANSRGIYCYTFVFFLFAGFDWKSVKLFEKNEKNVKTQGNKM